MRMPRLVIIMIIFILALFPAVVYAATDHSHGAGSAGTAQKQEIGGSQSGQGATDGHGEKSAAEGHESSGGHGGEPEKNALEPFKNQIVAGFAGLNLLVIVAALIMKKKLGQGV
ncbi:MAG: hypothetical protein ACOY4I_09765 [Bacillota bacterium]